jgi:hypothetical protein
LEAVHDAYELAARRRRRALEAVTDDCAGRDDMTRTCRAERIVIGALERL